MSFWLVHRARVQLKRLSHLSRDTDLFHSALWLSVHFILAFFIAALTPLFIRRAALPSSIRQEIELNLAFKTCDDDLHGICSFPSATVEYEKGALFSPSVTYALSIRLRFADIRREQRLGVFQNVISLYDKDDLVSTYSKSSYLRTPGLLSKLLRITFFPVYYCGLFYDYNILDILLTPSHFESVTKSSTKLSYQLQDRFAEVESAMLIVDARFGIAQHFLYNWPLTSSTVLFISSFSACCFLILVYWGTRSLMIFWKSSENSNSGHSAPDLSSSISIKAENPCGSVTAPISMSAEEYIPDNVDEIPCCSDFSDVPIWEIKPVLKNQTHVDSVARDDIR
ncbi:hypothetical protein KIN20_035144 [Parelaphostrongylus tenuis]|uniref:Seipin n=1 Tax=Parelaphostrongylus tenuis TaxID=148309 RepID=A0AAD5RBD5_PARTN|nr:hypothetical protein KIN20_035144 [Parelaphostrongylus tenuis]